MLILCQAYSADNGGNVKIVFLYQSWPGQFTILINSYSTEICLYKLWRPNGFSIPNHHKYASVNYLRFILILFNTAVRNISIF